MNIKNLGQIFTPNECNYPKNIVNQMIALIQRSGNILEPSSGLGAFSNVLKSKTSDLVSIEIDSNLAVLVSDTLNMDFFDYPISKKFDTIIGNPPYVRNQDILQSTKDKFNYDGAFSFDGRTNLYMYFIDKCIKHLKPKGELIFITPRDFFKATSMLSFNKFLYESGCITHVIDFGDEKIFSNATPNCVIWRYELDNKSRKTIYNNQKRKFVIHNGQLLFLNNDYTIPFSDIFDVKVGAVSGKDYIFTHPNGNMDFVNSTTITSKRLRRMFYNVQASELLEDKKELLERKIKKFDENNWWMWGRGHHISDDKRIYVNCKTRVKNPFFTNDCNNWDGSVMALFPKNQQHSIEDLTIALNAVDWNDLGFVCNGRYIFGQKSLMDCLLPKEFEKFK